MTNSIWQTSWWQIS